jgi:hypothetical protein
MRDKFEKKMKKCGCMAVVRKLVAEQSEASRVHVVVAPSDVGAPNHVGVPLYYIATSDGVVTDVDATDVIVTDVASPINVAT